MGNPFLRRRLHCDSTLAPSVSIRQTPLSLLASVLQHHLHSVKSFVSLLSLPSFRSCISPAVFIAWHFFLSTPPSINKQFLRSHALSVSCISTRSVSALCHLLLYQSHPFLSAHYPLQAHTLPHPSLLHPARQTTLPSRSIIML